MNKESKLALLENTLDKLRKQLDELKATTEDGEGYEMFLEVRKGCLSIRIGDKPIGYVCEEGFLHMLFTYHRALERHEKWLDLGAPVRGNVVTWKGGHYTVSSDGCLRRTDILAGKIYDFRRCGPPDMHCSDTNLKRHKYLGGVIVV